jgi:hypothetical protein
VQAESARTRRLGRIAFAFLLWIDLLIAALVLAVGADAPTSHMTVGLWWFTIIAGGIPLALVSGLAVRRGYAGHRAVLAAAVFTTAALYVVFPFAFIPVRPAADRPRALGARPPPDRYRHPVHPDADPAGERAPLERGSNAHPSLAPSFRSRIGAIPRRYIVGTGVLLLLLIWLAGTNSSGMSGRARRRLRRHGAVPLVQGSRDPARRASGLGTA